MSIVAHPSRRAERPPIRNRSIVRRAPKKNSSHKENGGANGTGTVFKITPTGTLTTLYSFCSQTNCTDGASPAAGLVQATDGDFYGTTFSLNLNYCTVFKITPSGTLTTLYSFCSQPNCTDGALPSGRLVQDTNGDFYGTAGGSGGYNYGNVFRLSTARPQESHVFAIV